MSENGDALQFASERCRGDKRVVLAAVRSRGRALEFASQALNGDQAVLLAAIEFILERTVTVRSAEAVREAHRKKKDGDSDDEDDGEADVPGGWGALI